MVTELKKGGDLKLVRNPQFRVWSVDAKPDGYPNVIHWANVGTPPTLEKVLRDAEHGRIDAALQLVPPLQKHELQDLTTRYPGQVRFSTALVTNWFFLNTRVRPFDDVRVRRAVNFAFDRQALRGVLGRATAPTCQILPPNFPSFHRTCPFTPGGIAGLDKARALVQASGTAGETVSVWGPAPTRPLVNFMVSTLKSLGYKARPHIFTDVQRYFPAVLDSRTRAQVGFYGWIADFPSEAGFLRPTFSCSAFVPDNRGATSDPSEFCSHAVDRLLDRASAVQAADPPAAHGLWQRAERLILAQAPLVPMSTRQNVDFVSKRVGNYQYHPQWGTLVDQFWVR
jgi:peptide/nickel transport system substrate-binding protein